MIAPAGLLLLLGACRAQSLPAHPRLVLTNERRKEIATFVATEPTAAEFYRITKAQADYWLGTAPTKPSGPNGTPNARIALQNVYSTALAWVVSGNASYAQWAMQEAYGAAMSPQWDPDGSAQLNTGEMMHVAGFAFDWFYDLWSPEQRSAMVSAIATTGLLRVYNAFTQVPPPSYAVAFVSTGSNWNSVILGGTIMSCLAIQDEPGAPSWVPQLLNLSLANLKQWSGADWAPDGAWLEGPNYGGYAARYLAPTIGALLTSTGSDGGLLTPGVLASPHFLLATMSPNLEYHYYFDTRSDPETVTAYLAFAGWAGDGAAAYGVKQLTLALAPRVPTNVTSNNVMNAPVGLLYYTPIGNASAAAALPKIWHFQRAQAVSARASWTDPNATFIGFKGRNTTWNWAHTHLDGGSFVYQREGTWITQDLGSDNYGAPGYFSPTRFRLYRTGTAGHNTLSFGGLNQFCIPEQTYTSNCTSVFMTVWNVSDGEEAPSAVTPDRSAAGALSVDAYGVMSLTDTYRYIGVEAGSAFQLDRVERGFVIGGGVQTLVVVDEIDVSGDAAKAPPVWWSAHTVANVSISSDGQTAVLSSWNVSSPTEMSVLSGSQATDCPGAKWNVTAIDLQPPLVPTPGVKRVTLVAPTQGCRRLVVAVGVEASQLQLSVRPLADWQQAGPFA